MTADILLIYVSFLMILGMFSDIIISAVSPCDPKTQYTVRNMKSGEFKRCKNVHDCRPNQQPDFPAGSDIDVNQSVGHCHPCGKGTYSPGGIEQCKKCQYTKCFAHQVIEGTCPDECNHDSSVCMDKCEEEYIMNSARNACELVKTTNITSNAPIDLTSIPTSNKATSTPTMNPMTTLIATSTPTINLTTTFIATSTPAMNPTTNLTATLTTRSLPTTPRLTTNPTTSPPTIYSPTTPTFAPTTTPPTGNRPTRPILAPKHGMSVGEVFGALFGVLLSVGIIAIGVHCCWKRRSARVTRHRQRSIKPDTERGENESFIQSYSLNTDNHQFFIANPRINENYCGEILHETRRHAQMPQSIDLSLQQPTNTVPSFGNMPYQMWLITEETFERNAGAVTWKDLAAWFGLTVNDVNRIEHMDSKTRKVIETWVSKTRSGVPQFENILRKNKIIGLADAIKTWMQNF